MKLYALLHDPPTFHHWISSIHKINSSGSLIFEFSTESLLGFLHKDENMFCTGRLETRNVFSDYKCESLNHNRIWFLIDIKNLLSITSTFLSNCQTVKLSLWKPDKKTNELLKFVANFPPQYGMSFASTNASTSLVKTSESTQSVTTTIEIKTLTFSEAAQLYSEPSYPKSYLTYSLGGHSTLLFKMIEKIKRLVNNFPESKKAQIHMKLTKGRKTLEWVVQNDTLSIQLEIGVEQPLDENLPTNNSSPLEYPFSLSVLLNHMCQVLYCSNLEPERCVMIFCSEMLIFIAASRDYNVTFFIPTSVPETIHPLIDSDSDEE